MLDHYFENSMGVCLSVCITTVPGQPAGLSREVCPYAGAGWLQRICQSKGSERPTASHECPKEQFDTGRCFSMSYRPYAARLQSPTAETKKKEEGEKKGRKNDSTMAELASCQN